MGKNFICIQQARTNGKSMTKFPCTLFGSTNWPRPNTTCPLCRGEEEIEDETEFEPVEYEEE